MSDLKIAFCILCGLPAAGKTSLLNFLFSNLINKSKSDKTFNHFSAQEVIRLEKGSESMKVVGIQYDILLPFQLCLKILGQKAEDEKLWKTSRRDVLLLVNSLIHDVKSCAGRNQFCVSQPEGINDILWKRFIQVLQPLATSWESSINELLIVIDDNMHLRSMRYEYYKLAREYSAGFCQLFLDISLDKALERNRLRTGSDKVSEDVITKMSKTLEIPDTSKNSWEKFSLTISHEIGVDWDQITSFIKTAFLNPVQPLLMKNPEECASSHNQCSSSLLHQADLILRKCVSAWVTEKKLSHSHSELHLYVKHANLTKENILSKLRTGDCNISISLVSNSKNAAQDPQSLLYKFIENLFLTQIQTNV